jgi:hypothetical protein
MDPKQLEQPFLNTNLHEDGKGVSSLLHQSETDLHWCFEEEPVGRRVESMVPRSRGVTKFRQDQHDVLVNISTAAVAKEHESWFAIAVLTKDSTDPRIGTSRPVFDLRVNDRC